MRKFKKEDIWIYEGWVNVLNDRVGLWWYKYNKEVCLSYGFGKLTYPEGKFIANSEDEVKEGILKILEKC